MSRLLGRAYDVLSITNYLKDGKIEKFKRDNKLSTWQDIEDTPKKLSLYLSNKAIDFLNRDKIYISNSPLRKNTFISVPEFPYEKRIIRFPSLKPKEEFKREYGYFLGTLLSYYQIDSQEEFLETGKEFDELLPLLCDYLILKSDNKEEKFSLKYIDNIKCFTKYFSKHYNEYNKFSNLNNSAEIKNFSDKEYDNYMKLVDETDEEMENYILQKLIKLSSLDGVLQIIDKNLSKEDIKELIEKLMINEDQNKSFILYDYGVESYGFRRLRKEIDKYRIK